MKTPSFVHALLALIIVTAPVRIAVAKTPWLLPAEDDPLPAEVQQQIRTWVNEGAVASAKNDWEGARAALLKAWDLKPLPMIGANLGYVEVKLGRYREAAERLQYFLKNAPSHHPERQAEAEQQLAECRKHVAVINVSTDVDGARVVLDSLVIGLTPLRRQIFLDPGTYTIEVTRTGYQPDRRTTTVQAGSDLDLQFKLLAEPVVPIQPAPVAQATSVQPVSAEHSGIQPRTWVLIGGSAATAISLGVGIAFRIKASSLYDDANAKHAQLDAMSSESAIESHEECRNPAVAAQNLCEQMHSTWVKYDNASNISTGAFVTAGILGVATAATYLLWPSKKSSPSQPGKVAFGLAPLSLGKAQGLKFYSAF